MDGLRPDREDVDRFRQNQKKKKPAPPVKSDRWEAPVSIPAERKTSSVSLGTVLLFLLFGAVVVGASYWLYEQQRQQVEYLKQELSDASELIRQSKLSMARFEGELSETGQELETTDSQVQQKISFLESEIRKLWGVSYDRNRKAIGKNEEVLNQARESLESMVVRQGKLESLLAAVKGELATAQQQLLVAVSERESQSKVIEQLSKDRVRFNEVLNKTIEDVELVRVNMDRELQAVRAGMDALKIDAALEARIIKTEKAIEAIDATRLQLNQRFVTLERRVNDTQLAFKAHMANPLVPK